MSQPQIHTAQPVSNPHGGHGGHGVGVATAAPGVAAVPDSYFTESRKGEVNELRQLLRNFSAERNPQRKRDSIKKVIAYMTLGIDVSRLFTEMMLAIETRDLVIKKMVYLYLCNYAQSHPEMAQMCTNTLQKDCGNEDPMVRGLALRALCSLRLPQMVEYISEPLRKSLNDHHAYVRKTAVMGILKLHHLVESLPYEERMSATFEKDTFCDLLYDMLRDADSSVVTNVIIVLNELMKDSPAGGMAINRAIMLHLLNRIHEFAEFAVVQVLELVPRYMPASAEEGYQIMNLLDPVLRTSSAASILATIKAFLSLADSISVCNHVAGAHLTEAEQLQEASELKAQVVGRIKAPLVTLISSGCSELEYVLLKQMETLVHMCPGSMDDEYRQMYIKHSEPTHVKYLKVQILSLLANPDTAPDIVAELAELVHSSDPQLARLCVRSLATIACRDTGGPGCVESIAQKLVDWLDLTVEPISSEAATALTQVIRQHPSVKPVAAVSVVRALRYLSNEDPRGKASLLYMLAECDAEHIPNAPYVLEKYIDAYVEGKLKPDSDIVKLALLNATFHLFVKRPPEVQRMFGRLLHAATDDVSCQDVHDRALVLYRLLKSGADLKALFASYSSSAPFTPTSSRVAFAEEDDVALRKQLQDEFNSLATIYGKPSATFVSPSLQVVFTKLPPEHPIAVENSTGSAEDMMVPAAPQGQSVEFGGGAAPTPAAPSADSGIADLLGFDAGPPAPAPAHAAPAAGLALDPAMTMTGEDYQNHWAAVPDANATVGTIVMPRLPASTEEVELKLAASSVSTMASGELPNEFKFFLYCGSSDGAVYLIQSNISKDAGDPLMIVTIKTANGTQADQLMQLIQESLGS